MNNYLTMKQLSAKLGGRSETSIRRDIVDGYLPQPTKLNGTILFNEDHVEELMKKKPVRVDRSFDSKEEGREALKEALEAKKAIEDQIDEARAKLEELYAKLPQADEDVESIIRAKALVGNSAP